MKVIVRPARLEEIPQLQDMLLEQSDSFEQQDIGKTICYVAECDGKVVGMAAGRLVWQIEPVLLDRNFKQTAPLHAQRKGTLLLIRAIDAYIADRTRNKTGIYGYFCSIQGKVMQQLAVHFGMWPAYENSKFFGRVV